MELMIVIVIIGILSAVGMVMFGGQSEKAKIAASKANHKQVVKFIAIEMQKCNFQDTIQLNYNTGNPSKIYNVTCDTQGQTTRDMALSFNAHFQNIGFKNPYNVSQNGVACNLNPNYSTCFYTGANKGQVIISITGSNIPYGNTFLISTKINDTETLTKSVDDPRY